MNATRGEEIGFWKLRRERSHQAVGKLEGLVKWYSAVGCKGWLGLEFRGI